MNTAPLYSRSYKRYVLLILTGVYAFNFIDRQILVILQEPIKAELGLSDTQLGLLTGFAFAIFYVTLGLPIARWADKSNRKNIVAISLAVWSAMTVLSGMVTNFVQLLLARIGVGVGEAGGSPPAHSIISDYFPAARRATALSVYNIGLYFGVLVGYLVGGYIGQHYGWRMALYILGVPGIIYALLVWATVKEPPKGLSDGKTDVQTTPPLREVMRVLFSKKTFLYLALATGVHAFNNYGAGNWMPSFLARIHGLEIGEIGVILAIAAGIGGGSGTFAGGWLADRWAYKDKRWYLWIPVCSGFVLFITMAFIYFSPNTTVVIIALIIGNFFRATFLGPAIAVSHNLVSARMRAFASAVLFFVLNLIGLGLGPLLIGYISTLLTPTFGAESIRWALCCTFFTNAIAIFLFYKASQHYIGDLEEGIIQVER